MRIAGVVAEYNPFHNGHALHVARTRAAGCDHVVAVMSGAFTQRGEPALCDKWARARMALAGGIDLVVELPALFAVRPAPQFALGGVTLLNALGADVLSFGCETDNLALLSTMAALLESEPQELKAAIRARLAGGQSHARARGGALAEYLSMPPERVAAPNTALALEYLRVNNRFKQPMRPLSVQRVGDYHDQQLREIASASAVRRALRAEGPAAIRGSVPPATFEALAAAWPDALPRPEALDELLLYRLRGMDAERLRALPDVAEGLEMRILSSAREATSREGLTDLVKCKRYTRARIARALTYALLDLTRALAAQYENGAPYARVLGFRRDAKPLLKTLSERAAIPLITDPVRLKGDPCFELERRATDLWGLTTRAPALRKADRDLTERMVVVD